MNCVVAHLLVRGLYWMPSPFAPWKPMHHRPRAPKKIKNKLSKPQFILINKKLPVAFYTVVPMDLPTYLIKKKTCINYVFITKDLNKSKGKQVKMHT